MFETEIYVKLIDDTSPLQITEKGDWIDLCANKEIEYKGPIINDDGIITPSVKIPLGIAMQLPEGYEAIIASRSSTYKTYGLLPWNAIGIIDNSYNGTDDQWCFGGLCMKKGYVRKGDRICQFRIQLSQKATMWQKIKWFLSNGKIKFIYVDKLSDTNRSGFGKGTGAR